MWKLAEFLFRRPSVILILSLIPCFCVTTYIFYCGAKKLPSFQDPQRGFETRGTDISARIGAWDKLIEELKPYKSLVTNPGDLYHAQETTVDYENYYEDELLEEERKESDEEKNKRLNDIPTKIKNIGSVGKKKYKQFHHLNNHRRFMNIFKSKQDFFCDSPDLGYSQIILTSSYGSNLFTFENIMKMCKIQHEIESLPEYKSHCHTIKNGLCCNMWSLPNYIAWLYRLPNCNYISKAEVNETLKLLQDCYKANSKYDLLSSRELPNGPDECRKDKAVYNLLHFVLDSHFLQDQDVVNLQSTDLFLPIAKSISSLELYDEIVNVPQNDDVIKISAMDLGVKYALFDQELINDTKLLALGSLFIVACVWLYTGCIFVTIMTLLAIFFSLEIAYYIYMEIFGLNFFPFMNILAVIIALGIGSDDAYIIRKLWDRMRNENTRLEKEKILWLVMKHSSIAIFVSTATTVGAFLSSYTSSIIAIRCFSIFAACVVIVNFLLMMLLVLPTISLTSTLPRIPLIHFFLSRDTNVIYENILIVKSSLDVKILTFIEKYPKMLTSILGFIGCAGFIGVVIWPKLRVPDSSEFQLFNDKHPFEQYDFNYKHQFWFGRSIQYEIAEDKFPLRFVWGLLPIDDGNYFDPSSKGNIHLDKSFDPADTKSQEWLLRFCRRIRAQPFYLARTGLQLSNCYIETFIQWMDRKCIDPIDGTDRYPCCNKVTFPYPRRVFNACIVRAMMSLYNTPDRFLLSDVAGPKFSKNFMGKVPRIEALVVEFDSNTTYTTSYEVVDKFYKQVESWMKSELKTAPIGMKNGFFVSHLGFYDLQRTLTDDTVTSIFISMIVALIVILLVTSNYILTLLSILTITFIVSVSIAILILLGWKLNVLESIAISVAIGLSVDFPLHYTVNYKMSHTNENRHTSTTYAVSMMAGPSLMAAITTGASGIFMLPSSVLPYIQIGVFLNVVSFVSWIYATFFLSCILLLLGPEGNGGKIVYQLSYFLSCLKPMWNNRFLLCFRNRGSRTYGNGGRKNHKIRSTIRPFNSAGSGGRLGQSCNRNSLPSLELSVSAPTSIGYIMNEEERPMNAYIES